MRTLPTGMMRALAPVAPLFYERVWHHVQVLLAGAILAPGKGTVSSALRAMGLDQERCFHRYHRVLSRASWLRAEPRAVRSAPRSFGNYPLDAIPSYHARSF